MIKLFNTAAKKKEAFKPLQPNRVKMYSCGPTVYDYPHIGNMRAYVFVDVVRRTFEYNGFGVDQIINITDVGHLTADQDEGEDKMELAARERKKTAQEIADYFAQIFFDDLAELNVKTTGTLFPRASRHIDDQIALIKKLEQRDYTYRIADGIYFDTGRYAGYSELAKLDLKHLLPGARVAINLKKRNPADFALWKFSPPEHSQSLKRQQEWPSPWGVGYPGWHIECSAMSMKYLGETLDIHTGGVEHIPVHHTNERAQSESATGVPFVHYWLHNEFLTVAGKKMAKSEGNFLRLKDLTDRGFPPLAFRLWLLTAHYRSPVNFTFDALEGARKALRRITEQVLNWGAVGAGRPVQKYVQKFKNFLNDDFDTPRAVALTWELQKDDALSSTDKKATLLHFDQVLGLNLAGLSRPEIPPPVAALTQKREAARKRKEWAEADRLRGEIQELGYKIEDSPGGPKAKPL